MQYGKTLKLIRDKRAYTLEYVTNEIGISTDKLIHIESQVEAPDKETLSLLSDFYKVPLSVIEHFSIDHDINGNKDEQRRKELKDEVAYSVFIEDDFDLGEVMDNFKELRQLKIKREGLKVS